MDAEGRATICCDCLKVVGVAADEGRPCPDCGGAVLVEVRGRYDLGADLSGRLQVRLCRGCELPLKITDSETGAVVHGGEGRAGRCRECQVKSYLEAHPDPSDAERRYRFDDRRLVWVLNKVQVHCPVCGKDRWVGPGLAWKKTCEKCYRKGVG
jgi:hypothetical protein